ncbi:hypothetical protein ACWOF5_06655 [Carnobacterium divergens]
MISQNEARAIASDYLIINACKLVRVVLKEDHYAVIGEDQNGRTQLLKVASNGELYKRKSVLEQRQIAYD